MRSSLLGASLLALASLAGGTLAAACSGPANLGAKDGGTVTGNKEEDGGLACSDFATAKCEKFSSCTNGVYIQTHFTSMSQCVSREEEACKGILAAPDSTATPNGFEQCGKDLTTGSCADFFDLTNQTPACTPQMGTRANGRSCVNNGQCQSTWCYAATSAVCGVCATRPAAGATCSATVDCGGLGMLCSETHTCAQVAASGAACSNAQPCAYGFSCVGSTVATPGKCEPSGPAVGASCDNSRVLAPLCNHDLGLYCPAATDTCALETFADAGAACGTTPGTIIAGTDASTPSTAALCGGGGTCEPANTNTGTCDAPAADGADCNNFTGPGCLGGARCVSMSDGATMGTCAILETTKSCD